MTQTATEDRARCEREFAQWGRDTISSIYNTMRLRITNPQSWPTAFSIPHELSGQLIEACDAAGRGYRYEHEDGQVWGGLTLI